jgi:hypothetical protein
LAKYPRFRGTKRLKGIIMDTDVSESMAISRFKAVRNDLIYRKKRLQEKVEPDDAQVLPEREQRELDGVPSFLALRKGEELAD